MNQNSEDQARPDYSVVETVKTRRHFLRKFSSHTVFAAFIGVLCLLFLVIGFFLWGVSSRVQTSSAQSTAPLSPVPSSSISSSSFQIIGFLPSWTPLASLNLSDKPLTQLIYFGLGVTDHGDLIKLTDDKKPVTEWNIFNSSAFSQLREQLKTKGVKVLVAIKNFDNESIDALTSNPAATNNFTKQLVKLAKEYELDGVNLDFEYITNDSEFPTRKYLNKFIKTISDALKKENPEAIVSIDVNATAVIRDVAYDMVKIGEVADQVILMGYDYKIATSPIAGHIAPLYSVGSNPSINKSITSLAGRVPSEKVILGVPFYGYEWETISDKKGSYTVENTGAVATYKRVQELLDKRRDVKKNWDENSRAPWILYRQSGLIKQIYYEDERSLSEKMKYVKEHNVTGVAIWALGYEGDYNKIWEAFK